MKLVAKVLTVSDGVHHGVREDRSGVALEELLVAEGWEVAERRVVPDGVESVRDALREMAGGFAGLVVTTGGRASAPATSRPKAHGPCSSVRRPDWPRPCAT